MKPWILLSALGLLATPAMAQDISTLVGPGDQAVVAVVPHDQLAAALAHKANSHVLTAANLAVEGNFRDKAGVPEMHTRQTDVFYITDGEATIVTGGTYAGAVSGRPNQFHGGAITGGTPHHMVKGDVMVIPAGIPHQFVEVPTTVSYYVVKVEIK
jgi:mannose-6-phosphate isomerase-like protein (cupin superfamily)